MCGYVCAVFSRIRNTVFQNRNKVLKEIFLLINYGVRGFVYKVELCPTLYTDSLLFTQSPTLRDLGEG